jgi:methionine aminopeptidase
MAGKRQPAFVPHAHSKVDRKKLQAEIKGLRSAINSRKSAFSFKDRITNMVRSKSKGVKGAKPGVSFNAIARAIQKRLQAQQEKARTG